ncbi:hypothetical protein T484DRAFT_1842478, partial [Baffinella frigidus]
MAMNPTTGMNHLLILTLIPSGLAARRAPVNAGWFSRRSDLRRMHYSDLSQNSNTVAQRGRCLLANGALPLLALLATCSLCSAGGSDGEILEEDSPWGAVSLRALCRSGWPSPACDELDRVDVGGAGELDDGPTDGEVVVGDVAVTVELAWSGGDAALPVTLALAPLLPGARTISVAVFSGGCPGGGGGGAAVEGGARQAEAAVTVEARAPPRFRGPVTVEARAPPRFRVVSPGVREVVLLGAGEALQVIVAGVGVIPEGDGFSLVVFASPAALEPLDVAGEGSGGRGGMRWQEVYRSRWRMDDVDEENRPRKEKWMRYIHAVELPGNVTSGQDLSLVLIHHPEGSEPHRVADTITVTVGEKEPQGGPSSGRDREDDCARYETMPPCGGCAVLRVERGVALSTCEGARVEHGDPDPLLRVDERVEARHAAASLSVLEAAGTADSGEAGVTVTVTSCGRLDLLDETLASLWKALEGEAGISKVLIIEDSGDAS